MKATVIQLNIEWGSPQENIERVERLMLQAPGSDLYVLPEMWSTGFATEPDGIAEIEENSLSLLWMRSAARRFNCAISGSLAIRTSSLKSQISNLKPSTYLNRHYFIDGRSGAEYFYDKHHLFRYGGEDRYYQPGATHTIVEYCGIRFLLLTCYDLRFPVWSRNTDSQPYDVIICVANWPQSRQTAWDVLTRSRAIENQAFLIGVNRVGDDNYSHYQGCSRVVSPLGDIILQGPDDEEAVLSTDIDIDSLQAMRQRFRVLNDADSFRLI